MFRQIFFIFFILFAAQEITCPTVYAETLKIEDAVQMALSDHQRIVQAQELYLSSSASAAATQSDRLPRIDFGFSYDKLKDSPYQSIGGTPLTTNDKNLVHYQINIKQPLFTGFSLSAQQKLAELNVDKTRYDLQQARRLVALDVNISALQLLQSKAMQKLAEQQYAQLKNHLADVEAAYNQGMIPGNDRLKAEVALLSAEQQLHTTTSQVTLNRSRLNLLIGRPQRNPLEIIEPQITLLPQQPLATLIDIAIQQRPEIHTAQLALASSGENIRLAESRKYPQLALVASYWRDGDNLSASHNSYRNQDNASIGLHVDWNLFSAGADRKRVAASQHQQRAQLQVLFDLQNQIRLQVEETLHQLEVASSNQQTAAKALEQARENHRLSIIQFHENLISTSDLLAARTLLTQAETDFQSAHYGILLANAQLSFVLGQDPLPQQGQN